MDEAGNDKWLNGAELRSLGVRTTLNVINGRSDDFSEPEVYSQPEMQAGEKNSNNVNLSKSI